MKLNDYIRALQVLADNGHGDKEVYLVHDFGEESDKYLSAGNVAKGPVLYGYRRIIVNGREVFVDENWRDFFHPKTDIYEHLVTLEELRALPPFELMVGLE